MCVCVCVCMHTHVRGGDSTQAPNGMAGGGRVRAEAMRPVIDSQQSEKQEEGSSNENSRGGVG